MSVARRILGVVVGYALFAVSAVFLFQLSGRDPHAAQPGTFIIVSIAYGMVFATLGGYVSAAIGGGSPRFQAGMVGVLIALGAAASLLASPKADSPWSMLGALFLMAPSTLLGGLARGRQASAR